ncbi:hypothetical protein RJ639_021243 [Escallonia herrerae]|uniref:RING-type E3 ubiquitin transferase n=1 Tax=Escallonia herrerae TaxID=1293975 RepID=A0AA89AI00_9ASTE|nr:hypothetical protein RJ639_021243 [Escallonia herrerae]
MGRDACKVARCGHKGAPIRFPFRLDFHQPEHCGYPGFTLTCNPNNQTVLQLPSSVNLPVEKINYKLQTIHLHDPNSCLPKQLPNLNLSNSPFAFTGYGDDRSNFSLFNCPPPERNEGYDYLVPSESMQLLPSALSPTILCLASRLVGFLRCRMIYLMALITRKDFT